MNETPGLMKARPLRSEEATLSPAAAVEAFRAWISAELLTKQRHWLGAESKRQKRSKVDLLTEALAFWVGRHPEERLTRPQLFNVMRAAVGEFMAMPPAAGWPCCPPRIAPFMTIIDERDLTRMRGIISELVLDYDGSPRAFQEAYRIVEAFLRRSTAYTRTQLTLPVLEGLCREAARLYPRGPDAPRAPRLQARSAFPFPWLAP